jgi:ribonuclease Z
MKRKLGWTFAILVLLVGAIFLFGRSWIAERAFEQALDSNIGVDQSAQLPDGLHVYVCGSGSPMPDADRAGPCLAVIAGRDGFVFDAGSGSVRKLLRMGFPADRMQAAFLTHLHSDHIDGLGELLLQAWVGGSRGTPLPVYGPPGTEKVLAGLATAYEIDSGYRVAHHGPATVRPGGIGGAPQLLTLPEGTDSAVAYDRNGVKITVIRVDHAPIAPAYAYRIDYKRRSVALSGDTVYSPSFTAAAKDVDVMFHEALNPQMIRAISAKLAERGRKDAAKVMADIPGYHASPEDAARSASAAGAGALVLYHMVPPVPARVIEPLFLGEAPKHYAGPLKIGRDGMLVSLPAGGTAVSFSQLF